MNLNRPLIQTEDCSPTWLETSAMQAEWLRVLQQILAYMRFRRRTNREPFSWRTKDSFSYSWNCSWKLSVCVYRGFQVDIKTTGFPHWALLFCRRCDSITSCIFKSETTKLKQQRCTFVWVRLWTWLRIWNDVKSGILCSNSQSISYS